MKNIFLILILSFFAFIDTKAQTTSLQCQNSTTRSVQCQGCPSPESQTELFDGMLITRNGKAHYLYKPFYPTFTNSTVKIRDIFGHQAYFNLSETIYTSMVDLKQAIADCINPTGSSGSSINSLMYDGATLTINDAGGNHFVAINEVNHAAVDLIGAAGAAELGVNYNTGKLFYKNATNNWAELSSSTDTDSLYNNDGTLLTRGDTISSAIGTYDAGSGVTYHGTAGITAFYSNPGEVTILIPEGEVLLSGQVDADKFMAVFNAGGGNTGFRIIIDDSANGGLTVKRKGEVFTYFSGGVHSASKINAVINPTVNQKGWVYAGGLTDMVFDDIQANSSLTDDKLLILF